MSERVHYDSLTLCSDFRFIRVVSEDGVFYDLVRKWRSRDHIFRLEQTYASAESLGRAFVPPCVFRDFTELDGPENYREAVWKEGTQFLFPLKPLDEQVLSARKK